MAKMSPLRRQMRPAVAYFHSATSSLRASATIVVFRRRPPLRLTGAMEPARQRQIRLMSQR